MNERGQRSEKRLDVREVLNPDRLDSEAQKVGLPKSNAAPFILVIRFLSTKQSVGPLRRAHNAEVLANVGAKQDADSAEDVVNVRICETEPEEEERLRNKIALETLDEKTSLHRVLLIVILRNDGFVRLCHAAMHFVEDDIAAPSRVGQILLGELQIDYLASVFEGTLQELIVVRGPSSRYWETRKNAVASGRRCGTDKPLYDGLIQTSAAPFLVQVILRDSNKVGLPIDI
jgi:hypothetical protein